MDELRNRTPAQDYQPEAGCTFSFSLGLFALWPSQIFHSQMKRFGAQAHYLCVLVLRLDW